MATFEKTLMVKGDSAVYAESAIDYHNYLARGYAPRKDERDAPKSAVVAPAVTAPKPVAEKPAAADKK
ncbi:hypothetical protein SEA_WILLIAMBOONE_43 [Gordonia phage WilliamBoone]|nr:hypothetical protein SEA_WILLIAMBOONE_43 [Gordonia phage WilliamBoone]